MKVQIISATALKDKTVLQRNVDEKVLNIAIREFQELELEGILGIDEYNRLQDVLAATVAQPPTALTDADTALMSYVTPVMVYGSLMYSISPLHKKLTNAGTQVDSYQNATAINDLAEARADYAFKLDGYKRKLIEYIGDNDSDNKLKCANIADTTFNFSGIALPDRPIDYEGTYERIGQKTGFGGGIFI